MDIVLYALLLGSAAVVVVAGLIATILFAAAACLYGLMIWSLFFSQETP